MSLEQIQKEGDELLLEINRMVSFCPNCLTYGTPFGLKDTICGNCHVDGLRQYVGLDEIKSFLNSRTTLAYQSGEKAMLEKVLGIIKILPTVDIKDQSGHVISERLISLDSLKEKLLKVN